ncbi:MAG: hemerythrin domain-containing protein [Bacteroidales bacterium]
MKKQLAYKPHDKMSDLICDNYQLLSILTRFGIPFGFGDKSIKEVCETHRVDTETFLCIANFLINGQIFEYPSELKLSIRSFIDFLKNAHSYYKDYRYPSIRAKLDEVLKSVDESLSALVLRFYDQYVLEVMKHMSYEERIVFSYVDGLLVGLKPQNYSIEKFSERHNEIDSKLTDLKNMLIKYIPTSSNGNILNDVLYDLFICEMDLDMHTRIEDYLFVPAIYKLEKELEMYEK